MIQYIYLFKFEIFLIFCILLLVMISIFRKENVDFKQTYNWINILLFLSLFLHFTPGDNHKGDNLFHHSQITDFQKLIVHVGTLLISIQAKQWVLKITYFLEFYILLFTTMLGLDLIISSTHFFMLFVAIELSTLPLIALVNFDFRKKISSEAAIKLLFSSTFSSAWLLMGVSLLYSLKGSMDLNVLFQFPANNQPIFIIGCLLFLTGLVFKLSAAPYHLWTADVFEGAPLPITNFMSVISKSGIIFIFIRIINSVNIDNNIIWINYISILIFCSLIIGNIFALQQNNLKRFFAFSSITQIGFILLGILSTQTVATTNCTYFVIIYLFSNMLAFGVLNILEYANMPITIDSLKGLYYKNKFLAINFIIALISLAGIPPVAGFFGKLFLILGSSKSPFWLIFVVLFNMIITFYFYIKIIKLLFVQTEEIPKKYSIPLNQKIVFIISIIILFSIGLFPQLYNYIHSISM